ncbi:HNH endonuclease [Nocardia sp. NPDC127579]|uniref:HNH endonuclease n=1 Tax=Nocardia sp. NPDC127579 TaxID=3345402 RepID=UPI00363AF2B0
MPCTMAELLRACSSAVSMAWSREPDRYRGVQRGQAARIRRRDRHTCQQCGQPGHEVDHIQNVKGDGCDEDSNLRVLCTACHNTKTQGEAAVGRAKRSRYREPEEHPGRLPWRTHGGGG